MSAKRKVIFLPATINLLDEYKGYLMYDKQRPDIRFEDVFTRSHIFKFTDFESVILQYVHSGICLVILVVLFPLWIIYAVMEISGWFNDPYRNLDADLISALAYVVLCSPGRIKMGVRDRWRTNFSENVRKEDVPAFMKQVIKSHYTVVLYGYDQNDSSIVDQLNKFKQKYNVFSSFPEVNQELIDFYNAEVNPNNAVIIVESLAVEEKWLSSGLSAYWNDRRFVYCAGKETATIEKDSRIIYKSFFNIPHSCYPYYIYSDSDAVISEYDVFYIGAEGDSITRGYITSNYSEIKSRFSEFQFRFIFLPLDRNTGVELLIQHVYDQYCAINPGFRYLSKDSVETVISEVLAGKSDLEVEKLFVEWVGLPELNSPIFLRSPKGFMAPRNECTYFVLDQPGKSIDDLLDFYFSQLGPSGRDLPAFSLFKPDIYDADLFFNQYREQNEPDEVELEEAGEDKELLLSIHNRLVQLNANKQLSLASGLIREVAERLMSSNPEFAKDLFGVVNKHTASVKLSRLQITSDYRIVLVDYNQLEIPMYPLAKIVYLLFLRHPKGIVFKQLVDYRDELMDLYVKVTGRVITPKIRQSISDLTDATNVSINQKVARIRTGFRTFIPEEIAMQYCITGSNAAPKLIALDRALVEWQVS